MARIDGLNLTGASLNPASAAGAAQGAGSTAEQEAAAKARGRQDVLNLSDRGRVVAEAAAAVANSRDVRTEKVLALKAAIANGTYASNAREIAARLLANGLGND
jgi:negative regulator of flagellin synthesis FlgM